MPAFRRPCRTRRGTLDDPASARRCLPLVLAAIVVGSCGGPPSEPTATATSSPLGAPGPTRPTPTPADSAIIGLPRIVMRSPGSSGATWWVTEAGRPDLRSPLAMPFADADLGPASPEGRILLAAADRIVLASVVASTLVPAASVRVSAGLRLEPGCFGGDGRAILADAETLELVQLDGDAVRPLPDVGLTLGDCAPLADGRTLVAIEGGGLVAVRDGAPSVPIVGLLGRHLSGGGGRVALTDPSDERAQATVRQATVSEAGVLGAEIGRVPGHGGERIVDAQLSPDGGWLAVTVEGEVDAAPVAWLRLYRVSENGLTMVTDLEIEVGTRIALLPGG